MVKAKQSGVDGFFEKLQTQLVRRKKKKKKDAACCVVHSHREREEIALIAALKLTVMYKQAKLHPGAPNSPDCRATPGLFQTTLCLLSISKLYRAHTYALPLRLAECSAWSHCLKLLADSALCAWFERLCVCV